MALIDISKKLETDNIYCGDSRVLLKGIEAESISLSVWSPPYHVGKNYEKDLTFTEWKALLREIIHSHFPVIKPGGFLVINIADVLCFKDDSMPRIMAENVSRRKVALSREEIIRIMKKYPDWNRHKLASHFNCSEQTIDRRLNGNNVRGVNISLRRAFVWWVVLLRKQLWGLVFTCMIVASGLKMRLGKIQSGILYPIAQWMNPNIFTYSGNPVSQRWIGRD